MRIAGAGIAYFMCKRIVNGTKILEKMIYRLRDMEVANCAAAINVVDAMVMLSVAEKLILRIGLTPWVPYLLSI